MKRSILKICRLAPTLAALALSACDERAAPPAATAAAAPTVATASAIVVAGGASDLPMDSLRTADALAAPGNAAVLAARLRDAQLPDKPAPEVVARAR
jgi:hypothetical protein